MEDQLAGTLFEDLKFKLGKETLEYLGLFLLVELTDKVRV